LPLPCFNLTAIYEGLVGDTGDPGLAPDFFSVNMDLTINPWIEGRKADEQLLLTSLTPPVTALLIPVPASIQNGVLVLPRQSAPSNQVNDPTQSNIPGVELWAKSALLNIGSARLLYDIIPGPCSIYGKTFQFDQFTIAAPDIEPPMPYSVTIVNTTGGTYLATVAAQGSIKTTTPLAWNATTTALQTALAALPNVGTGNVTVGGTPGAWVVTFGGALAGQAVALSTDPTLLTGATTDTVSEAIVDAIVSTTVDLTTAARVTDASST
jgi:hypothetical protein